MTELLIVVACIGSYLLGRAIAQVECRREFQKIHDDDRNMLFGAQVTIGQLRTEVTAEQGLRMLSVKEAQVAERIRQAIAARDHE